VELTKDYATGQFLFQVERHAHDPIRKLNQFGQHHPAQAMHQSHPVSNPDHGTNFVDFQLYFELFNLMSDQGTDFIQFEARNRSPSPLP
jgi:hypothetical protein